MSVPQNKCESFVNCFVLNGDLLSTKSRIIISLCDDRSNAERNYTEKTFICLCLRWKHVCKNHAVLRNYGVWESLTSLDQLWDIRSTISCSSGCSGNLWRLAAYLLTKIASENTFSLCKRTPYRSVVSVDILLVLVLFVSCYY